MKKYSAPNRIRCLVTFLTPSSYCVPDGNSPWSTYLGSVIMLCNSALYFSQMLRTLQVFSRKFCTFFLFHLDVLRAPPISYSLFHVYLGKCINFEILSDSFPSPALALNILITLFSYFLRFHPFNRQTKFHTHLTEHCG